MGPSKSKCRDEDLFSSQQLWLEKKTLLSFSILPYFLRTRHFSVQEATSFGSGSGAKQPVSVAEDLAQGLDASRPGRAELKQPQRDAMGQEVPDPRDMPSARSSLRARLISLARMIQSAKESQKGQKLRAGQGVKLKERGSLAVSAVQWVSQSAWSPSPWLFLEAGRNDLVW